MRTAVKVLKTLAELVGIEKLPVLKTGKLLISAELFLMNPRRVLLIAQVIFAGSASLAAESKTLD